MPMRLSWASLVLLGLLACGHTDPFEQQETGTDVPFEPGPPARLTANLGPDAEISFLPDGSELLYTLNDRCLGFLPAHMARARDWRCGPLQEGVLNGYRFATVSPDNRIALQLRRQREFESGPFYQAIITARLDDLADTNEVTPVPFVSAVDGRLHRELQQLAWLRGDTIAILTDSMVYLTDPADTVFPRRFVPLPLPGKVASIQSGREGSVLYLRMYFDNRVQVWDLGTGSLSVIHDFRSTPISAVAVGRRHLVAAIPGAVLRVHLSQLRVDTIAAAGLNITELAIAPDGSDIIASALGNASPSTDLYRLDP
jgi:hypothetical protein